MRVEQVGDAALQLILCLFIRDGVRDLRGAAIEIFGDEAELVVGTDLDARANVSGDYSLGKFRELVHGSEDALAEDVHDGDHRDEAQHDCA